MRPFVALFCLFLRHSFWKVLLLLAALGAAEWAIFRFQPFPPTVNTLVDAYREVATPLGWVVAVAFLLLCALLLTATLGWGRGRPDLTLARLPLGRGTRVLCQGVCNTLLFLLFWAAEALVLVGLAGSFARNGGFLGPQTLFVTGWAVPLLHTFLPVGEPLRWVGNLVLAAGLGFTAAAGTEALRRRTWPFPFLLLTGCALVFWTGIPWALLLFSVPCLGWSLWTLRTLEKQDPPDHDDDRKEMTPHAPTPPV